MLVYGVLKIFYSFVWVRIFVCWWNPCRATINYKALCVFSGMPQQYLNKELGYELDLWTRFMEKNVGAVTLGNNTFILVFFLLLKLVRVSHTCWEHGGLCPTPIGGEGLFQIWWGWLSQYMEGAWGGGGGWLKMLS